MPPVRGSYSLRLFRLCHFVGFLLICFYHRVSYEKCRQLIEKCCSLLAAARHSRFYVNFLKTVNEEKQLSCTLFVKQSDPIF